MKTVKVWDPVVRLFHWATAILFVANMTVLDEDGIIHAYAGYLLSALVALRLVWGLIGTKNARFRTFWPTRHGIKAHLSGYLSGTHEITLSHNPLGALMVINLMGSLLLTGITGFMLSVPGFGWAEGPHELLANYVTLCVCLHVLGVLIETRRTKVDLIRAMVTGRKTVPDEVI